MSLQFRKLSPRGDIMGEGWRVPIRNDPLHVAIFSVQREAAEPRRSPISSSTASCHMTISPYLSEDKASIAPLREPSRCRSGP